MSDGWIVPENRALAHRPSLLGLPLGYAALLIMLSLWIGLTLEYFGAALYALAFGWGVGKIVTLYDPFAWSLLAQGWHVPKVLRPSS